MIRNPNDIQEGAKKIRMLIAGYPGIGKSTLALSAPNPLHIDVDSVSTASSRATCKPYHSPRATMKSSVISPLSTFRTSTRWFSIPAAS